MDLEATAHLQSDHRRLLRLLDGLDGPLPSGASAVEERRTRAVALLVAESRHQSVEEDAFWPIVRTALDCGGRLADRALADHVENRRLMRAVEDSEAGSAEFEEALCALSTALREHLVFELQEVWPQLWTAAPSQPLRDLLEHLER
ncbi:hemerythrin domain-containing protein [Gordonia humi]|uniref:hemerythrin domain-containing protein n=1 Tax=Gordonia humi TaxID=686429 RepID=UPI00360BB0B4